jgi:hypothetical protein
MENIPFRNKRPSKRNAIATIGQAHNKPADLGTIRDNASFTAIQGCVAALQAIVIAVPDHESIGSPNFGI